MTEPVRLLIVGASACAAAFSALRAGITPHCIDRFGDADLIARCSWDAWSNLSRGVREAPVSPWLYTGAIENRPALVRTISKRRPLWGNDPRVLSVVRSPWMLSRIINEADLKYPAVRKHRNETTTDDRWLLKPLHGSGGCGIRHWISDTTRLPRRPHYFQQYLEGEACAAAYVSDGTSAQFLGVTRQLVGEPSLHASPFHYCGSIGPLTLSPATCDELKKLGNVLTEASGLRGLFGVDFILSEDRPWAIEVNPRYTASMEVLEFARSVPMLALHRRVFNGTPLAWAASRNDVLVGKAILFATKSLTFPAEGPWNQSLLDISAGTPPKFADIPKAGQSIAQKSPILSFFVTGRSETECLVSLKQRAGELDRCLF